MRLFPRTLAIALIPALLVALFCSTSALAREAVVTLKDGSKRTGEIVSDDEAAVVLLIANIRTSFDRADIASVEYVEPIETQYANRRAKIADDNLDERLALIRWLYDGKAFALAKTEVDSLKQRFPDNEQAETYSRAIEGRLKLVEDSARATAKPPVTPPGATPGTTTTTPPGTPTQVGGVKYDENGLPTERLSDKDINIIRVYEVELNSRPAPRVSIPKKVIDEFLTKYSDRDEIPRGRDQQMFRSAPGHEQLRLIFQLRAREFYGEAVVRDDPSFIKNFAPIHRTYVLNYCGTNNCHGGVDADGLYLFRNEATSDKTLYTNLSTLARYENAKGFGIDTTRPDRSYLYQYGLPVNFAALPHPDVKGWKPYSLNTDDVMLRNILKWIESIKSPVNLQYPLSLPPARVQPKALPAPTPTVPPPAAVPATTNP